MAAPMAFVCLRLTAGNRGREGVKDFSRPIVSPLSISMDSGPRFSDRHREPDAWGSLCMPEVVVLSFMWREAASLCLFLGGSDSRGSDLAAYAK